MCTATCRQGIWRGGHCHVVKGGMEGRAHHRLDVKLPLALELCQHRPLLHI